MKKRYPFYLLLTISCLILAVLLWGQWGKSKSPQPADGIYQIPVTLSGGSGRASLKSPCEVEIKKGQAIARIEWSSSNYDYMILGDRKYLPVNTEGNSCFEIPVEAFNSEIPVIADTTAMSQPHEISYILFFDGSSIPGLETGASSSQEKEPQKLVSAASSESREDLAQISYGELPAPQPLECAYAESFQLEEYSQGIYGITVENNMKYLIVPEDLTVRDLPEDMIQIHRSDRIYVASSACMDLFCQLEALDQVKYTSIRERDWALPRVSEAMQNGDIIYAGKYSAPDYELLISGDCRLAVENTMIFHSPEVREQLTRLGIPVFVDYSSYENHPLGRLEWIRVYGILTGRLEEADCFFRQAVDKLKGLAVGKEEDSPRVAFFHISSNGYVVVRRPGDYLTRMIEMAGGRYALEDLPVDESSAMSTMNIQMETFVEMARDADILIYNSTIDGEIHSLQELIAKNPLLAGFDAVKEGKVWCTGKNMFQESTGIADMILDFSNIIDGAEDAQHYIYPIH